MNSKPQSGPEPLAQDYTVVASVDEDAKDRYWFFLNTGFCALADGSLLAAGSHVVVGGNAIAADGTSDCCVLIARSVDHGQSWVETARIPFRNRPEVMLYARGETVYLFFGCSGRGIRDGRIMATASEDKGLSWGEPRPVICWSETGAGKAGAGNHEKEGQWEVPTEAITKEDHWYGINQMAVVEQNNRLYMSAGENCQTMAVAVCDLDKGVMNPQAWRISDQVEMPIPRELDPGFLSGPSMRCLEGNVIRVADRLSSDANVRKDRLRIAARAVIDRYGTSGMAAIFEVEDDGIKPKLIFTQLYPIPGGQGKFFIVYDETSKLYWMASNLPANTQGWVESPPGLPLGNDRRTLMLWYSCDALNWFPAGCIAQTEHLTEAFMYPAMLIDGDDLAVLVRTSRHYSGLRSEIRAAHGFHDANLMTFHRVRNFRALAMNIWPQV